MSPDFHADLLARLSWRDFLVSLEGALTPLEWALFTRNLMGEEPVLDVAKSFGIKHQDAMAARRTLPLRLQQVTRVVGGELTVVTGGPAGGPGGGEESDG